MRLNYYLVSFLANNLTKQISYGSLSARMKMHFRILQKKHRG